MAHPGASLAAARRDKQLTQAQLAAALEMGQRQISDLERGVVDARWSTVENVARALDLEPVLIPSRLIAAVEGLMRADASDAGQPMYRLDEDEEAATAPGATDGRRA